MVSKLYGTMTLMLFFLLLLAMGKDMVSSNSEELLYIVRIGGTVYLIIVMIESYVALRSQE
jgi:threonine/homoserine/homoserine lactone efflux protein